MILDQTQENKNYFVKRNQEEIKCQDNIITYDDNEGLE